ncbi:hypothetical protein [Magnetospirillum molischianum]|uniref:Uncharacterized protein n=1 Tax=Magnetospirillum molischianum DSM 120 TaxID=1150626 RepID=H8FPK9_MAGML|nr:hypothetical protein [Magnetospirillum molischianum]CCG40297.1 conserved hypothetical protein [Magnetospirillum molischianum DSM 120]
MTSISHGSAFESKVGNLLALTSSLTITQIIVLQRMIMATASAWATPRELKVIFNAILDRAVSRLGQNDLAAAAARQFNTLLAPGSNEELKAERSQLFDVAQKYLTRGTPRQVSVKAAQPMKHRE